MRSHRLVGALIVCCILVGYIVLESRLFFLSLCPVGTLAAPWFRCVDSTTPGATQASPPHSSPPPPLRVVRSPTVVCSSIRVVRSFFSMLWADPCSFLIRLLAIEARRGSA